MPARVLAHAAAQSLVDQQPGAVGAKAIVIMSTGAPVGKVMGDRSPRTAAAQQVKDAVEHFANVDAARSPAPAFWRDERFYELPLLVGQIRWIRLPCHDKIVGEPERVF